MEANQEFAKSDVDRITAKIEIGYVSLQSRDMECVTANNNMISQTLKALWEVRTTRQEE